MQQYSPFSPYSTTSQDLGYLDVINFIDIAAEVDDIQFTITSLYTHRPDLLAYDIYNEPKLWWAFAVRNKETIKDPVFDFVSGKVIYLPKLTNIKKALGV
jgi:hypothetical protein